VCARQPCDPIPRPRDVGQWLCVPPFRVVCLYQACTRAVNDVCVTRTQQRWYRPGGAARRAWGPPGQALHGRALPCRFLPAGISAMSIGQAPCQRPSTGEDPLSGPQSTRRPAEGRAAKGCETARGVGKNCWAGGPGGRVSRPPPPVRWRGPPLGWGPPAPGQAVAFLYRGILAAPYHGRCPTDMIFTHDTGLNVHKRTVMTCRATVDPADSR
jgi:hypothetical protein